MNCDEIKNYILDLILGESDLSESEEFENHLSACESCKTLYSELKETYQTIESEKIPLPSDDFWNDFDSQLQEVIKTKKSKKVIQFPIFNRFLAYAASILIVVLTGLFLNFNNMNQIPKTSDESIIVKNISASLSDNKKNVKYSNDLEFEGSLILNLNKIDTIDKENLIELELDNISNLISLSDYSTALNGNEDSSYSEYVLTELINGFDSSSLQDWGNQTTPFFDPVEIINDLYYDYMILSDEERELFENGLYDV